MLRHVSVNLDPSAGENLETILSGTGPGKKRVTRVLVSNIQAAPTAVDDAIVYLDTEKLADIPLGHAWNFDGTNWRYVGPLVIDLDVLVEVNELFKVGIDSDAGANDYDITAEYEMVK